MKFLSNLNNDKDYNNPFVKALGIF